MSGFHAFLAVVGFIIIITIFFIVLAMLDEVWKKRVRRKSAVIFEGEPRWGLSITLATLIGLATFLYTGYRFSTLEMKEWFDMMILCSLTVISFVLVLGVSLRLFAKGRIVVDNQRFEFRSDKVTFAVDLTRPFEIKFGKTIRTIIASAGADSSGNTIDLPTIVCDITQDGRTHSFYYDAPFKETELLPDTTLRGEYLFRGAELILKRIRRSTRTGVVV